MAGDLRRLFTFPISTTNVHHRRIGRSVRTFDETSTILLASSFQLTEQKVGSKTDRNELDTRGPFKILTGKPGPSRNAGRPGRNLNFK
jgi:hypothetical protein